MASNIGNQLIQMVVAAVIFGLDERRSRACWFTTTRKPACTKGAIWCRHVLQHSGKPCSKTISLRFLRLLRALPAEYLDEK